MQREARLALLLSIVFVLVQGAPFLFAQAAADGQHVFGGFFLNPIDGASYLAKMRQGLDGAWSFTLPYTAQPGAGAAINLYYLFLGHAARTLGWGLVFAFHAARLLGAAALCAALWRLLRSVLPEGQRIWALALALFGSGLGWLAALSGTLTSDFWVAEAYPFLAAFANAHFPLGLALQIYLLTTAPSRPAVWLLAAVLLSVVYPFGWAVALAVLAGQLALARLWRGNAHELWRRAICTLAGGLPYAAYALWIVRAHPVLSAWNAQNLTPAPPPLDLLVSLAPAALLAAVGAYFVWRTRPEGLGGLLAWALVCIVLVYFPLGLQRRFISGVYVPTAALAVYGAVKWLHSRGRAALIGLLLLALPTNVLILFGAMQAARSQQPALYLHRDELAAYAWLQESARDALVLAPPENGLYLPAYATLRVWYGHPFETVQADARRAEVEAFFAGELDSAAFLAQHGFDFVLYDARRTAGPVPQIPGWEVSFSQGDAFVLAPER